MQPESVPSPCINVCRLDAQRRWCTGCWRSLDEIATWARMDDAGKWAVVQQLPLRRATHGLPESKTAPNPT